MAALTEAGHADAVGAMLGEVTAGKPAKRLDIQGLRTVAVSLVIIFHAGVAPVEGGFVGVDVFFVISGFLITGIITRDLGTGSFSMLGFWANRARRLLPAAFVAIATTCLLSYFVLPATRFSDVAKDGLASAYYGLNWRLAAQSVDYLHSDDAPSPFQHFWSLGVEEQFYLVWPLLLAVAALVVGLKPRWIKAAFAVALALVFVPSLMYSVNYTQTNPAQAYFVTPTRMWELALGGGVAIAMGFVRFVPSIVAALLGWGGLVAICWSAVDFTALTPFPGSAALVPTLGAAAVLAFGERGGRFGPARPLSLRPVTFVGDISYSLYLWHWPLIVLASHYFYGDVVLARPMLLVGFGAIIPAYLSYRLVERPALNSAQFASNFNGLRLGFIATGASLIAAALLLLEVPNVHSAVQVSADGRAVDIGGKTLKIGAEVLPPNGRPVPVVHQAADITPDPVNAVTDLPDQGACIQVVPRPDDLSCTFGDPAASTVVALVGDSHAMQWLPAAIAAADAHHWRIVTHTKQACPFQQAEATLSFAPFPDCQQWNDAVLRDLIQEKPTLVVTSSAPRGMQVNAKIYGAKARVSRAALRDGLLGSWRALRDAGIRVAVVADTPEPNFDVPGCVESNRSALQRCAHSRSTMVDEQTGLEQAVRADPTVRYVNLVDKICPGTRCAPVIGRVLVYRDSNHLSATYAVTLARAFGDAVARLLS